MIPIKFMEICLTSLILFFIFVTVEEYDGRWSKHFIWSILMVAAMGAVNAFWVKQSFWLDVLLPISLISFFLFAILYLLDNNKLPILSSVYKVLYYVRGFPWSGLFVLSFIVTISTTVFALTELSLDTLFSFSKNNVISIWAINSYLFGGSVLLLVLISIITGITKGLKMLLDKKCLMLFHDFGRADKGCTCRKCGKTIPHKWNGCKCERCGKIREEGHNWNGCECQNCGTIRDINHQIDGCVCKICHHEFHDMVFYDTRDYSGDNDQLTGTYDLYKCTKCGVIRR